MLVARHLLNLKPLLPGRNLKTAQTFVQSPILSFTIGQFFQLSDADPVGDNRVAALEDTTGLVKNRIFHFATHKALGLYYQRISAAALRSHTAFTITFVYTCGQLMVYVKDQGFLSI